MIRIVWTVCNRMDNDHHLSKDRIDSEIHPLVQQQSKNTLVKHPLQHVAGCEAYCILCRIFSSITSIIFSCYSKLMVTAIQLIHNVVENSIPECAHLLSLQIFPARKYLHHDFVQHSHLHTSIFPARISFFLHVKSRESCVCHVI